MKKWIALLLALLLTFSLAACGGKTTDGGAATAAPTAAPAAAGDKAETNTAAPTQSAAPTAAPTEAPAATPEPTAAPTEAPAETPSAGKTVTITLPADLIGDVDPEDLEADIGEEGLLEATLNEDGSVTLVMTKEKHEEVMQELADAIDESVQQILEDESTAAIFKSIEYDKDYSSFRLYVDQEAMTGFESFYALVFCMAGANYQAYAGKESYDVPTELIDASTGEVIETITFDDYLDVFAGLFGGGDDGEWDWGDWESESLIPLPEIEPTVLLDQDGVKVTATGFNTDLFGSSLRLEIENNSDTDIMVTCERFLVNNYSSSGGLYSTVAAGESMEDTLYLPLETLVEVGVEYIGQMEIQLKISEEETYSEISVGEPVIIRTSDYGAKWDVVPEGEEIYNDNGVRIVFLGVSMEESWGDIETQFDFYFENNGDRTVSISSETFAINGIDVGAWIYVTVPAGKRALDYALFYSDTLEEYEIETPETLDVEFSAYDPEDYDDLFDTGLISIILGVG